VRVIGVVDLKGGKAVHARGGSRASYEPVRSALLSEDEVGDAVALSQAYRDRLGLREIYVADLDRIVSGTALSDRLPAIAAVGVPLMVDAGVTSIDAARAVFDAGAARVVVGLETLTSLDELVRIAGVIGPAGVVFSVDVRGDQVVAQSPGPFAHADPVNVARAVVRAGVRALILLDLARVGQGVGPDCVLVERVRHACPLTELVAGGGVRDADDLDRLAVAGADAVLVGTALYRGQPLAR
jgi:phosphoribosylformimino-5-aminoimidazole carboxamide ribotide isomerase